MNILWREPLYSFDFERDVIAIQVPPGRVRQDCDYGTELRSRTVTNTPFYVEQFHNHRLSHRPNCEVAFDPAVRTITIEFRKGRIPAQNGPIETHGQPPHVEMINDKNYSRLGFDLITEPSTF